VKNYIDYLESTYLIFQLEKYDYSLKKQIISPKKIYAIDTAFIDIVSFKFSEDLGRLLENIVFIELKRRGNELYYHKNKKECDFVIKEGLEIIEAIQVTRSLSDPETRKREIEGLLDAMRSYNLKEGLILTEDEEEMIEIRDEGVENREKILNQKKTQEIIRKIYVKPIWKWLLE
jgi:predicted AAA+ superfamily ATPase